MRRRTFLGAIAGLFGAATAPPTASQAMQPRRSTWRASGRKFSTVDLPHPLTVRPGTIVAVNAARRESVLVFGSGRRLAKLAPDELRYFALGRDGWADLTPYGGRLPEHLLP